jgi:hypothetical protein
MTWMRNREAPSKDKPTWVYMVAETGVHDHLKVGIAIDVQKRLESLQGGNPRELIIVCACMFSTTLKALAVEKSILASHNRLASEWIKLQPVDGCAALRQAAQKVGHEIVEIQPIADLNA